MDEIETLQNKIRDMETANLQLCVDMNVLHFNRWTKNCRRD